MVIHRSGARGAVRGVASGSSVAVRHAAERCDERGVEIEWTDDQRHDRYWRECEGAQAADWRHAGRHARFEDADPSSYPRLLKGYHDAGTLQLAVRNGATAVRALQRRQEVDLFTSLFDKGVLSLCSISAFLAVVSPSLSCTHKVIWKRSRKVSWTTFLMVLLPLLHRTWQLRFSITNRPNPLSNESISIQTIPNPRTEHLFKQQKASPGNSGTSGRQAAPGAQPTEVGSSNHERVM